MPFIANLNSIEENHSGNVVGNGHCAVFVQAVSSVGVTTNWRQGTKVAGNTITPGTVIATFSGGRYRNYYGLSTEQKVSFGSHAGIFISQTNTYIYMWQQYVGKEVHKQIFKFQRGRYSSFIGDGDNYFVVEHTGNPLAIEDSCWEDIGGFSWSRSEW